MFELMLLVALVSCHSTQVQEDQTASSDSRDAEIADAVECVNTLNFAGQFTDAEIAAFWQSIDHFNKLFTSPQMSSEQDPLDLSEVSPELQRILERWEAASRESKKINVDFTVSEINRTFRCVRLSEGQLKYQSPHLITIVLRGVSLERREVNRGAKSDGIPYVFEAGPDETWVWNDPQIIKADERHPRWTIFGEDHDATQSLPQCKLQ